MKSLREGQFSPIYILMGEESYFIDKITDYIAQHALREEERDFNQTVCFGIDVSAGQVADMARETGKLVAAPERATPCRASFQ